MSQKNKDQKIILTLLILFGVIILGVLSFMVFENFNENNKNSQISNLVDKKKVTANIKVSSAKGIVTKVRGDSIGIKIGGEKKEYKLLENGLGVFKKNGKEFLIIDITEIKIGDEVYLEAREVDDVVNSIIVE